MNKITYVLLIGFLIIVGVFLRPVCVLIPAGDLKNFVPSIEQRQEEQGMIYKIWKQKNGDWYQCKSAGERFFFS